MLRKFITLLGLLVFSSSLATTVRHVPLEHMAQTAEVIFYGRVISNDVRQDDVSQRVATFTRFEIIDAIKGVTTDTYTVKQFGGQLPGSTLVHRIHGMPRFNEGEEYIVFLPQASRLGFASPIGLMQGSFSVNSPESGDTSGKTVSNGRAINTLLPADTAARKGTALKPVSGHPAKATLQDFLVTVRALSGQ
ncbi:MAG: hypothetical protein WBN96_10690 [Gammaproteobacteria bacterium]